MKKVIAFFIKAFIVTFCFIADVKVHADIVVEKVKTQSLDIQSFDTSTHFVLDGKKIGVEKGSLFSIDQAGEGQLSTGNIFFSIPAKSNAIKIHTPQADVVLGQGDFLIEILDGKTRVNVLMGSANLLDRALKKNFQIGAGYSSWLGGLLATGRHAGPVRPEACDLDRILEKLRTLMSWSEKEFQSQSRAFKNPWKDAVLKVADDSQTAVDNDIEILNSILAKEKKREDKINHEQALLRKLFREKTVGVPVGNTGSPSETDRDPASDLE